MVILNLGSKFENKVSHPEPTEWRLDISQVKRRDAGWYMCQVSQNPPIDIQPTRHPPDISQT